MMLSGKLKKIGTELTEREIPLSRKTLALRNHHLRIVINFHSTKFTWMGSMLFYLGDKFLISTRQIRIGVVSSFKHHGDTLYLQRRWYQKKLIVL